MNRSRTVVLLATLAAAGGCSRVADSSKPTADTAAQRTIPTSQEWQSAGIPVEPRHFWRSASDGERFVLWGGQAERGGEPGGAGSFTDGALFEGSAWKALPPAGVKPRVGSAAILAGDRLVVWGGSTWAARSPSDQLLLVDVPQYEVPQQEHAAPPEHKEGYLNDGAVYDLKTLTVKRVPPAPIPARGGAVAVDLGGKVLFWGGWTFPLEQLQGPHPLDGEAQRGMSSGARSHLDGAVLDLGTLEWKKIAEPPVKARNHEAIWAGTELAVLPGLRVHCQKEYEVVHWYAPPKEVLFARLFAGGALYDPAKGMWKPLPENPALPEGWVVPIEEGLVAWGKRGFIFRDGSWQILPSPPVKARFHSIKKGRVLLWKGGSRNVGAVLDLETRKWATIPECPLADRSYDHTVWDGDSLLVSGGLSGPHAKRIHFADGARWRLGDTEWIRIRDCPLETRGRYHVRQAFNRRYLVLWGGNTGVSKGGADAYFDDAASYDRTLDRWAVVAPVDALSRWIRKPRFAWLGGKLLVVDGSASHAFLWTPSPPR